MTTLSSHRPGRVNAGFTLVELLITVVIIAILAAVGYPSYIDFVVRGHRQAARSALYRLADRQEQFYLDNKRYAADLAELLNTAEDSLGLYRDGQFVAADAGDRTYVVTMEDADDISYTLSADPQLIQAERDTDCGKLSLTSTGDQQQEGAGTRCW